MWKASSNSRSIASTMGDVTHRLEVLMAAKKRWKLIHYARAKFVKPPTPAATLQGLVEKAFAKTTTMSARTVRDQSGSVIQPRHQSMKRGAAGALVHLVSFTADEPATTVPHPTSADVEKDLSAATAPARSDYMDGEAFLLITGSHVLVCSTNLSDKRICWYLDQLLLKSGVTTDPSGLDLRRVANLNMVELIEQFGVKSVTFDASLYEASQRYINRRVGRASFVGKFYEQLRAILLTNKPAAQADAEADLMTEVTIKLPSRNKSVAAEKALTELVTEAIQEDGESNVSIQLGNGMSVSSTRIAMSKQFGIVALNKGLSHHDAFDVLDRYLDQLRGQHLLSK
jgi:hypothetical protein